MRKRLYIALLLGTAIIPLAAWCADSKDAGKNKELAAEMLIFKVAFPGMLSSGQESSAAKLSNTEFHKLVSWINDKNFQQLVPTLKLLAQKKNNAWSELVLGNCYEAGLGVKKSLPEAFVWYLRSAEAGNHFAQRQVANLYFHGWGAAANLTQVERWYQQAIAVPQGPDMLFLTAHMISPFTKELAAHYFKRSIIKLGQMSAAGNGIASYELGVFYQYGLGLKKNNVLAKNFYTKALTQHCDAATKALSRLEETHA